MGYIPPPKVVSIPKVCFGNAIEFALETYDNVKSDLPAPSADRDMMLVKITEGVISIH